MNDKCCSNCAERYVFGKCPFNFPMRLKGVIARSAVEDWDDDYRSCDLFSFVSPLPKPEPGKIKPLPKSAFIEIDASPEYILMDKVNEIIAVVNRSVK